MRGRRILVTGVGAALAATCLSAEAAGAAITLIITEDGMTSSETLQSGTSIAVPPSALVQIQVQGSVVDPCDTALEVSPPDVTVTLPDAQTFTLLGFVDLAGTAGGGLVDESDEIVIPSALEGLTAGCPVIFADGFESGDTTSWSSVVAGVPQGEIGAGRSDPRS